MSKRMFSVTLKKLWRKPNLARGGVFERRLSELRVIAFYGTMWEFTFICPYCGKKHNAFLSIGKELYAKCACGAMIVHNKAYLGAKEVLKIEECKNEKL